MAYLDEGFSVPIVPMVMYLEVDAKTRDEERARFAAGETRNPQLRYHQLDLKRLREANEKLKGLTIPEAPPLVQGVMKQKVASVGMTCDMLLATGEGEYQSHTNFSISLYGQPDANLFWGIVSRQDLADLLGLGKHIGTVKGLPDPQIVQRFGERVRHEYKAVLELVDQDSYEGDQIVDVMNRAIPLFLKK